MRLLARYCSALCRYGKTTQRRLWVTATSTDRSLDAAISQCAGHIRSALEKKQQSVQSQSREQPQEKTHDSCFVLVSQSYSASDINRLTSNLKRQLDSPSAYISVAGTVVDRILASADGTHAPGLSILYHTPRVNSLSDAESRDRELEVRPFFIGDMHGRQRLREVAVGRWHNEVTDRFKKHQNDIQWKVGQSSATQAASHLELPHELGDGIADPSGVELIIMAADKESRQVLDALDARFPQATKIGIVGSQTPFLNGQEYTLLGNAGMEDSGVIGFAFVRAQGRPTRSACAVEQIQVTHGGLEAISDTLEIKRSKGNVVLEVEDGEAARLLIASVRKRRMAAGDVVLDDRLFAKITGSKDPGSVDCAVFQVTGGDPAKGGLAIDTLQDIAPGQFIQFMMAARPPAENNAATVQPVLKDNVDSASVAVQFGAADFSGMVFQEEAPVLVSSSGSPSIFVFGGVTEGGFIYGAPSAPVMIGTARAANGSVFSGSTECAVPGSMVDCVLRP
ncbi:hypothetical protein LPJ66_010483 [Kickxella alabastrina]|uniref:Uncharacterized protein n=1 Tax=Kickxella alabastrina TaxID=61397 RepID=A0ACC1I132_9FUNG|nr:hypothetical protein LPJ66_010483 [Kickxella alabastrina]